jgi:transposase-like protein
VNSCEENTHATARQLVKLAAHLSVEEAGSAHNQSLPRAARQRCPVHQMRNLAAKVPEDAWPDVKVRV